MAELGVMLVDDAGAGGVVEEIGLFDRNKVMDKGVDLEAVAGLEIMKIVVVVIVPAVADCYEVRVAGEVESLWFKGRCDAEFVLGFAATTALADGARRQIVGATDKVSFTPCRRSTAAR